MIKLEEKRKAIELRTQGLSYREIRQQVPVARSTLSLWLRGVGLAMMERQRLADRQLAGGRSVHARRVERIRRIMAEAEAEEEGRLRLQRGDWLWLIGTILYWAEGTKPKEWRSASMVIFTNTDPRMILMMKAWFVHSCSVSGSSIQYAVQIHEKADTRCHWILGDAPGNITRIPSRASEET